MEVGGGVGESAGELVVVEGGGGDGAVEGVHPQRQLAQERRLQLLEVEHNSVEIYLLLDSNVKLLEAAPLAALLLHSHWLHAVRSQEVPNRHFRQYFYVLRLRLPQPQFFLLTLYGGQVYGRLRLRT